MKLQNLHEDNKGFSERFRKEAKWQFYVWNGTLLNVPIIFEVVKHVIPYWLKAYSNSERSYEELVKLIDQATLVTNLKIEEWPELQDELAFHTDDEFGNEKDDVINIQVSQLSISCDRKLNLFPPFGNKISYDDMAYMRKILEHSQEVYKKALDSYLADRGQLQR